MKQILQHLGNGQLEVADVPCPELQPGQLLIRSTTTLISAGTERMLVEFGKANLIKKARQQPERVRLVWEKIKTDGLMPTLAAVRSKLDRPLALGYSNAGVVLQVGLGVTGYRTGDRVASNGKHAEVVSVPAQLCAPIPDAVSNEAAAFTVVGAIALQGMRLAQPTLGETFAVTGLGLIGLLAVQLLRAQGCRVLAIDFNSQRLALARSFGAETVDLGHGEDPLAKAALFSRQRGVDGVLITATTASNEPVRQAAQMCRKRGRIVLVGVVGLELSRADFYEKELSFQVSCSYGPGRYDTNYEEKGRDYPIGFVRWTEQRNFEAVLDMLADGRIDVAPLISHRFPLTEAEQAYSLITGSETSLGIVIQYPGESAGFTEHLQAATVELPRQKSKGVATVPAVGFIGAGNYATQVLIPAFRRAGVRLDTIVSQGGVSSLHAGRKHGFAHAATNPARLFQDSRIDTIVIATRHDSHAEFVLKALQAGKHVFVEKPLALKRAELEKIASLYESLQQRQALMVGFNRRFAPQVQKIKALLSGIEEPKSFIMTVNAGAIPREHWTQDHAVGGGRIIGEACHFVDLLQFLAGAPVRAVQALALGAGGQRFPGDDKVTFTLGFADGSVGTVHYLANGHRGVAKERLEVFCAGRILQLDNFRRLRGFGWPGFKKMDLWRQDKGQEGCVAAFVSALREGRPAPISFAELSRITRTTFDIAETLAAPVGLLREAKNSAASGLESRAADLRVAADRPTTVL